MRMGGERQAPATLPPGKRPDTYYIEGWVGPRGVWSGAENFDPIEIRSPDPFSP